MQRRDKEWYEFTFRESAQGCNPHEETCPTRRYNFDMENRRSPGPLIAVLLLLPVLLAFYVGSYIAFVEHGSALPYRDNEAARIFFWPLEQIDRTLRPLVWGARTGPDSSLQIASSHGGHRIDGVRPV